MYAVIKTGGKQYRVQPGDLLVIEKLDGEVGAEIAFDQVMMLGAGDGGVTVGAPMVEGAVVRGTLIETRKGDKIKVFKKIRRQGYRRTKGHRQHETVVRVTGLEGAGHSARWEGEVDLTPRSVLRDRARGLSSIVYHPAPQARRDPAEVVEPASMQTAPIAAVETTSTEIPGAAMGPEVSTEVADPAASVSEPSNQQA